MIRGAFHFPQLVNFSRYVTLLSTLPRSICGLAACLALSALQSCQQARQRPNPSPSYGIQVSQTLPLPHGELGSNLEIKHTCFEKPDCRNEVWATCTHRMLNVMRYVVQVHPTESCILKQKAAAIESRLTNYL